MLGAGCTAIVGSVRCDTLARVALRQVSTWRYRVFKCLQRCIAVVLRQGPPRGGDGPAVSFARWVQTVARMAALTAALVIGGDDADACLAHGLSFGGSATGTFMRLTSAAPADTGITRPPPALAETVAPNYPGGSLTGLFQSGGWLGRFAAGFLGSGFLGLLFGRGLVSGLAGVPSYLGLIVQLALLVALCRLIWTRWRSGGADGAAALSPRQLADPYLRSRDDLHSRHEPSLGSDGTARPGTAAPGARSSEPAHLGGERK